MASKTTGKSKTPAKKTKSTPAKKTAAKKPSTPKQSTARKTSARKRSAKPSGSTQINPLQREKMIEVAAYYRAEKRGFNGGDPQEDWFHAEAEVDKLLRANQIHVS